MTDNERQILSDLLARVAHLEEQVARMEAMEPTPPQWPKNPPSGWRMTVIRDDERAGG